METHGDFAHSHRLSGRGLLALAILLSMCKVSPAKAQSCGSAGLAVQVLGSGGPELQDKSASTSYLIWDHGTARIIVDAGGGSALRFGESGAKMSQVDVVLRNEPPGEACRSHSSRAGCPPEPASAKPT